MAGNAERTYLMIKPDGVQRGLVGDIISRFEKRGYKLVRPRSFRSPSSAQ
jgi:nucleoside-diphosphate kinase